MKAGILDAGNRGAGQASQRLTVRREQVQMEAGQMWFSEYILLKNCNFAGRNLQQIQEQAGPGGGFNWDLHYKMAYGFGIKLPVSTWQAGGRHPGPMYFNRGEFLRYTPVLSHLRQHPNSLGSRPLLTWLCWNRRKISRPTTSGEKKIVFRPDGAGMSRTWEDCLSGEKDGNITF